MSTKTCPQCGGSGNPSVSGVQQGSASGCPTCNGQGWVYDNSSSGGGGGCFTGETKVKTLNGWKEIHSIKKGDEVFSINREGELSLKAVLSTKMHSNCKTLRISTDKGIFGVTSVHSVQLPNNQWSQVSKLSEGDSIYCLGHDSSLMRAKIQLIEEGGCETVYNLIVEGNYTFITNGCVAHSFTYFREIRVLMCNAIVATSKLFHRLKQVQQFS